MNLHKLKIRSIFFTPHRQLAGDGGGNGMFR